jgi:N-acetylmuramoyl-L-alanine amidase
MLKKLSALALASAFLFTGASSSFAYTVQSGDTMTKIAKNHNLSLVELSALNPEIKNLDLIYVGQNVNTNKNNTQTVSKPVAEPVETVKPSYNATASEIDLMARLVRAEAESEPYAGKVAVAYVVLNRVDSSQFPNTIEGVIYQSGQFSPVSNGEINKPYDADSLRAVKEALSADRSNSQSLFFYNPKTATSRWLDSRETVTVIGNHVFKK